MKETKDQAYFTRKMFVSSVLPAPLAAVGMALAEMGDTILVGHILGVDGLAAVGFATPLFLLATFFVFGLSMGGAVVFANFLHEGKKEQAGAIFRFFLWLSAAIGFGLMAGGLLFQEGVLALLGASPEEPAVYEMAKSYTFYIFPGIPFQILTVVLATYIRNDNAETLSIILQAMSGIGNLIISALLLMGFGWGIEGCSFGFFLANLVTFALGLGYICLGRGQLRLRGKAAGFRESFKALRLGFATSSEYIFDALFTLAAIHLLVAMEGAEGVAVFNIIENLALLFIFLYELIGKTAQPIFSAFFAECNYGELHRICRYCLGYSLLMGLLGMVGVLAYPQLLDLLFGMEGIEEAGKAYYAARIFCLGTIFMGVCLLLQNYLQSEEDEKGAFLVVFMRRLGAGLPLVFLLARYGFFAFWFVYPLSEIVTLTVLYAYYRRRGEHRNLDPARVYTASFLTAGETVTEQLEAAVAFAARWGAGEEKRYLLRLSLEELCGVLENEQKDCPLRLQLTLLAREDGTFELHLRDNGEKLNPFQLARAALSRNPERVGELSQGTSGLALHMVKSHASNLFYRTSQGFNTLTLSI